ncbi:MAG: hypothetical protein U0798_14690 [Gemmataceae bacterium]
MNHRRSFLASSMGLAGIALQAMLQRDGLLRAEEPWSPPTGLPHFAPKVKRVIWLFMIGEPAMSKGLTPARVEQVRRQVHRGNAAPGTRQFTVREEEPARVRPRAA